MPIPVEGWAEIFAAVGVRAVLTATINALPAGQMANWRVGDLYPFDDTVAEQGIRDALALAAEWHGAENGRITVMFGPAGRRHAFARPPAPHQTPRRRRGA
jgi:5-methylthioadenosine/S-adenosylhomocysteine deaminase